MIKKLIILLAVIISILVSIYAAYCGILVGPKLL